MPWGLVGGRGPTRQKYGLRGLSTVSILARSDLIGSTITRFMVNPLFLSSPVPNPMGTCVPA